MIIKSVERVLKEVFDNPTAPYRENWVLQYVEKELNRLKVPYFIDKWGNIIAGVSKPQTLKKSKKVALMAHTDHPGFHLIKKITKTQWRAQWFGGVPPKTHNAKVAIYNPLLPNKVFYGKILSKKFEGQKKDTFKIQLTNAKNQVDDTCFGAFAFPGFQQKKHRVFSRAADDLAGVTIILATFARLNSSQRKNILGVFTRAEETGFKGALGIIYQNILGHENTVISLEASRQLEGARIGSGPVIRLGDKRTLFDNRVTSLLDLACTELKKINPKINFQRRIMNGGTCEATAFNLHHIKAAGIAVPLGNYHNQRANLKPGAEFIDIRDVLGAVEICVQFYKNLEKKIDPMRDFINAMASGFKNDRPLLSQKIKFNKRGNDV
ncbi:MAG: hypothetical protein SGI74_06170 [Oligoflexia bacterium]|nr:hypothetical protein [Oligoflexia bacterium]